MKRLNLRGVDLLIVSQLLERPSYGYELGKRCQASLREGDEPLTSSQIYNSLAKLCRRGLISREIKPQPNSPARHMYRINTPKAASLSDWLEEGIALAERQADSALEKYRHLQEGLNGLQEIALRLTRAYGTRFHKPS